ncbi:MAG: hypothetical protein Q7J80_11600, partial [Anaerolineales bacterium]|nr:hypothetical protein [Anaerolineales bacterium]
MSENPHPRKRQNAQAEIPPQQDWLDRLAHFNAQFGRFLRDGVGVALIAFALMSLLAVWEFTDGILLSPFSILLRRWFGWGNLLVLFGIGFLGYSILRRDSSQVSWGRLIALELASLLTLGLLAVFGGNNLFRAESGWDGGRLGWGLVMLAWQSLGIILGTLVIFLLWLLAVVTGFGLWAKLEIWLLKIAGEAAPVVMATPVPMGMEGSSEHPAKSNAAASRKKAQPLAPEFRTSLKASNKTEENSRKPPPRGEDLPPLHILLAESAIRADDRT